MNLKVLKTLPEEVVLKAIEGHENVLAKAEEVSQELFRRLRCPYAGCGGAVARKVDPDRLFKEDEYLPNYLAACKSCGCEFDPHTGIIIVMGRDPG